MLKAIDRNLRPAKPKTEGPGQGKKTYDVEFDSKWVFADYIYEQYPNVGCGSLNEFSRLCNFAPATLEKFEHGIAMAISMEKFLTIAQALNIDPKTMARDTGARVNIPWPVDDE